VFYLLLLALPFAALALLSLVAFLGALAVAGAMHVAGVVATGARVTSRGPLGRAPLVSMHAIAAAPSKPLGHCIAPWLG